MAANGEIPGALRTPGGHWKIPDSPELKNWVRDFAKAPSAQRIVDLADDGQLRDSFRLVKEILKRAHSLRCLIRRGGWAHDSPIWGFLFDELRPLRLTLETLKMPIEDVLAYIKEENREARKRGILID